MNHAVNNFYSTAFDNVSKIGDHSSLGLKNWVKSILDVNAVHTSHVLILTMSL